MTEPSAGDRISLRVYGHHPLQCERGSSASYQGGICFSRHHHEGRKDILGVWIGENESSKFWLNVLNDLKGRGVKDVYLFCTDGLCGVLRPMKRCSHRDVCSATLCIKFATPPSTSATWTLNSSWQI